MLTSSDRAATPRGVRNLGVTSYLVSRYAERIALGVLAALGAAVDREPAASPRRRPSPRRRCASCSPKDNRVNQLVATALLRKDGHTVTVVADGAAAVAASLATTFDAILMDVRCRDERTRRRRGIRAVERVTGCTYGSFALTAHAMQAIAIDADPAWTIT